MKHLPFLSLLLILTACNFTIADAQVNKNLIVLVKYKTQPGKDSVALAGIKNLITQVKKEPGYVSIVIHVDPADKSGILLYEEWASAEYYKGDHMKTAHLQQFMKDARIFLVGPPEISFWEKAE